MSSSLPFILALLSILFRLVTPTTYQVSVGQNGIFYVPNTTTTRNIGDKVQFNFYNNHSVVEGDFITPCVPRAGGGFYSGFIATPLDAPAAPQYFVVTINDTQPHYYYCAQEGLCNAGMVGVINPPSNQPDDLEAYAVRAAETDPNASPDTLSPPNAPIGGVISIESAASANNDDSYSYLLTAFASGPVATPTNGSVFPTATTKSIVTPSSSAGSSSSRVSTVTSIVTSAPTSSPALTSSTSATSSPALTSSMSATSSSLAPSASTTKKGAAGRDRVGDTGLVMIHLVVLVGIILSVG